MKSKRKLGLESLEGRRLLAFDCFVEPNVDEVGLFAQGEAGRVEPAFGLGLFAPEALIATGAPDLVHETDGQVVVVDASRFSEYESHLFIFDRTESGELDLVQSLDPGFNVQHMVVHEDRVVMIGMRWPMSDAAGPLGTDGLRIVDGQSPWEWMPETVVASLNLSDPESITREAYRGHLHDVMHDDGQLVMVLGEPYYHILADATGEQDADGSVEFPEPTSRLYAFRISDEALTEVGSTEVDPFGQTDDVRLKGKML